MLINIARTCFCVDIVILFVFNIDAIIKYLILDLNTDNM